MKHHNKLSFSDQDIYVGIDTGKNSWKVTIRTGDIEHKTISQEPKPQKLLDYLHRNFPEGNYHSVYEAGYFGFWIHDALVAQGVDNIVVHASDVPTMDKERRNRNDYVDSRKLARSLQNGDLVPLYVPSPKAREDRSLVRMRGTIVRKRTRCKNQIKSLLSQYGRCVPVELSRSHWSEKFICWLESLEFFGDSGKQSLAVLVSELRYINESINGLTQRIGQLSGQSPYREQIDYLKSVPGIGLITGMILLTEIIDITRFRNTDHLASYVGIVPGEDSSGDTEKQTGISHRHNQNLRYLLIESSWVAVRKDPALLMSYTNYLKRGMSKNKAIICIARKLLNRISYVLKKCEYYVPCVVSSVAS